MGRRVRPDFQPSISLLLVPAALLGGLAFAATRIVDGLDPLWAWGAAAVLCAGFVGLSGRRRVHALGVETARFPAVSPDLDPPGLALARHVARLPGLGEAPLDPSPHRDGWLLQVIRTRRLVRIFVRLLEESPGPPRWEIQVTHEGACAFGRWGVERVGLRVEEEIFDVLVREFTIDATARILWEQRRGAATS